MYDKTHENVREIFEAEKKRALITKTKGATLSEIWETFLHTSWRPISVWNQGHIQREDSGGQNGKFWCLLLCELALKSLTDNFFASSQFIVRIFDTQ